MACVSSSLTIRTKGGQLKSTDRLFYLAAFRGGAGVPTEENALVRVAVTLDLIPFATCKVRHEDRLAAILDGRG